MIKRLRISDTDAFIDIINDAFKRELHHIGEEYGASKAQMKITYACMRSLQVLLGDIRDVPDIFAFYDEQTVIGVTKMVPVNARKSHWYTEITAVKKDLQQKGVGSALKQYTVEHYTGKANRFFGNLRKANIPSLKANTRVGYQPYVENMLFKKTPPHNEKKEIKGLRRFKNDQKGVFDLYMRTTPKDIVEIEDKTPEDFTFGPIKKGMSFLNFMGEKDHQYVIERDTKIVAYFYVEPILHHYKALEIMLDPAYTDLRHVIPSIVAHSPDAVITSYIPVYRVFEQQCLTDAGFEPVELYLRIARIFER
jgi:hypothetical protein